LVRAGPNGQNTYYVYGLGLLGQENPDGSYQAYHYDMRGSTVAITDQSGAITDQYQYGPYGELVSRQGTTDTPFLFNGRDGVMTDSNGLYYMRARYYNPEILRFVNSDVLLGNVSDSQSMNRYAYVNGQPVNYVDPFGLCRDEATNPLDTLQDILGWVGLVPGIGDVCDAINALIYLVRGRYLEALISVASIIPGIGLR
jgi:RHS repeat-associated protein